MRVRVVGSLAAVLLWSVTISGCGNDTTAPASAGPLANDPFFIRGSIAETGHPWGTLVRGEGSPRYPVSAAAFTVGPATRIQRADGTAAAAADLIVGRRITVWSTGVVLESLPPQIEAQRVIID